MPKNLAPPKARFSICLLENSAHELLFLKRSANSTMGPNQWGFPAGHIEQNESPMNCARREIDEEIGLGHTLELRQVHAPVRDSFYGGHYEIHLFHFIWREGAIRRYLYSRTRTSVHYCTPGQSTALRIMNQYWYWWSTYSVDGVD